MSTSTRIPSLYAGQPVKTDGDIASQTADPTLATHGHGIPKDHDKGFGVRHAAPRYLDIWVRMTTAAATASLIPWLFYPEVNSGSGRWYPLALIALAASPSESVGSILKINVPRNASRVYLQVADVSAGAVMAAVDGDA